MKKQIGLFLTLSLLSQVWSPALSLSGGRSSDVEIDRIERHVLGSYTLVLRVLKTDSSVLFGGCEVVTIEGEYSFFRWAFLSPPDALSWKSHEAALEKLVTAREQHLPVRFGEMGEGLKKRAEGSVCVWESRGLAISTEDSGEDAIYSFYKWP